jgi:hypothetical protein
MRDPHDDYTCSRDYHLFSAGPKRILSLDGGGVRGAVTVAFLKRIEELLDERMGREVRLGDWFDLVGGTSTGAIVAGALALGKRVDEVKEFYLERAPKAFATRWSIPYLEVQIRRPRPAPGNRRHRQEDDPRKRRSHHRAMHHCEEDRYRQPVDPIQ